MSDVSDPFAWTPAWQRAIRDGCRHPTGRFVRFEKTSSNPFRTGFGHA
jgi:hypothetical protein